MLKQDALGSGNLVHMCPTGEALTRLMMTGIIDRGRAPWFIFSEIMVVVCASVVGVAIKYKGENAWLVGTSIATISDAVMVTVAANETNDKDQKC